MKRLICLMLVLAGCTTNPYTGRKQLMLVDEAQERQLGTTAYQQALGESRISTDPREVEPLRRVGKRIADAAAQKDFSWEFNVIVDDKTLNAWCLPGGKIAFYTGIFPVVHDEAGMAFVMGHEVAHALLHHGAERMSQTMATEGAASLLGVVLSTKDPMIQQGALAAFGAATNVGVLLPFSRKHESEADQVGLELMARAGYDPHASVEVWKRMQALGGKEPPQWLSTHPSHETRIQDLESRLPQAMALYQSASKAQVAVLPPISNRDGKGGQVGAAFAPGGDGPARLKAGSATRAAGENGAKELRFEVAFERDVFVRSVEIQGPGGLKRTLDIRAGVPARRKNAVVLNEAGAPGPYTLTFQGSESGRPFRESATFDVR